MWLLHGSCRTDFEMTSNRFRTVLGWCVVASGCQLLLLLLLLLNAGSVKIPFKGTFLRAFEALLEVARAMTVFAWVVRVGFIENTCLPEALGMFDVLRRSVLPNAESLFNSAQQNSV